MTLHCRDSTGYPGEEYKNKTVKVTYFDYSLKNSPIPHPEHYMKCLIHKVEGFIFLIYASGVFEC